MKYKYTMYIKNEDDWPAVNEDAIQIGNYAEWDHVRKIADNGAETIIYDSEHGIDDLDPNVEEAINKAVAKFNQNILPESYINAGEVLDQTITV